jgi:hypothetical protein
VPPAAEKNTDDGLLSCLKRENCSSDSGKPEGAPGLASNHAVRKNVSVPLRGTVGLSTPINEKRMLLMPRRPLTVGRTGFPTRAEKLSFAAS